jgi:hypothetical protein
MRALRLTAGLLAIAAVAGWNAAVARTLGRQRGPEPLADGVGVDPDVVEHERNWYDYVRGFDVHHGDVNADGDSPEHGSFWDSLVGRPSGRARADSPEHGSFWDGLDRWLDADCLRGYTLGDHTYVCPNAPRVLRVHQAGHAPSFGEEFDTLRADRRADGGLDDEPLRTLDVMLPGAFPDTLLRLRDPRGLGETYDRWLREGRIRRR